MKKLLTTICFLLVFAFIFSGCASVHYSFVVETDGKISIGFEIDLDKTAIETAGYDYQDAKDEILSKVETVMSNQDTKIFAYCMSIHKLPSQCGIKTDYKYYDDKNAIFASLTFESKDVYKAYNNYLKGISGESDEEEQNEIITEEHWFYVKEIEKTDNPFCDAIGYDFVSELLTYFAGDDQKQAFTLDDVDYNYYYGLPESKVYSNSTYTFYSSGVKIHEWNFKTSEMENQLEFYTIQFKPAMWYALALTLTGVLLAVLGAIVFIQKSNNKPEIANFAKDNTENDTINSIGENNGEDDNQNGSIDTDNKENLENFENTIAQ